MNRLVVHLDDATDRPDNPKQSDFDNWSQTLEKCLSDDSSLCLRLVSLTEMTELNERFRGKSGATNVLSFPTAEPDHPQSIDERGYLFLGDIAICADVVRKESEQQGKDIRAHWTHLFFHGVLHLLGHDHQNDKDAECMEQLETSLLAELEIAAPYITNALSIRC